MHGEHIGIAQTPLVAISYLVISGILLGCAKFALKASDQAPFAPEEMSEPSPA